MEKCPKLPRETLKDFEISLTRDRKKLSGWTVQNFIRGCEEKRHGKTQYYFAREAN
jgi:hypothetical protein